MRDQDDFFSEELFAEAVVDPYEEIAISPQETAEIIPVAGERKRLGLLTPDQVRELVPRIASGDEQARDTLILHNLGLVRSVARRFRWSGLTMDDLIQDGVFGLVRAVEKFDLAYGVLFSTYAIWHIRASIGRAVCDTSQLIRIPARMRDLVQQLLIGQAELLESGVTPTKEVLADKLGVSVKAIRKVQAALAMNARLVSFEDAVPGYRSNAVVGDFVPDTSIPGPMVVLQAKQELLAVRSCVDRVLRRIRDRRSERDRAVFIRYYGFDADLKQRTLEETSERFGVTRERIRQILVAIWNCCGGDTAKQEFERMLAGIPALEELAQSRLVWGDMRSLAKDHQFLLMFQSTAKEVLTEAQFALCACHYGFNNGYRLRAEQETAELLGIEAKEVYRTLSQLWRDLRPYVRHLTRDKVKRAIESVNMRE